MADCCAFELQAARTPNAASTVSRTETCAGIGKTGRIGIKYWSFAGPSTSWIRLVFSLGLLVLNGCPGIRGPIVQDKERASYAGSIGRR